MVGGEADVPDRCLLVVGRLDVLADGDGGRFSTDSFEVGADKPAGPCSEVLVAPFNENLPDRGCS